jgi:F-type H+-transporting ATPase subunit b
MQLATAASAAILALLVLTGGAGLAAATEPTVAQEHSATSQEPAAAPQHAPETPAPAPGASAESQGDHHSGGSLFGTLGRIFNFAVLVGVLVYYLRAPIAGYLSRRSTEIRDDLTKAGETREAAAAELVVVEQKMKALPAEIAALKERGAREVGAEEARIRQAADAERERLLEQARREIDLQVKAAERDLVAQAADLAVGLASDRIKRTITDEDQARLVDRYLADVKK